MGDNQSSQTTALPSKDSMLELLNFIRELATQVFDLSLDTVRSDLEILRPGHQFSVTVPSEDQGIDEELHGGINLHYKIVFDDGACWMLRVRRDVRRLKSDPKPVFYRHDVEREANALRTMRSHGIRTVPAAYLPPKSSIATPKLPTAHFYLDFMPGSIWSDEYCPLESDRMPLTEVRTYLESYADHQIALAGLSFDRIGQLTNADDKDGAVGPMYEFPLYASSRAIGPFNTLRDRLVAFCDMKLKALSERNWELATSWDASSPLRCYLGLLDKRRLFLETVTFAEKRTRHYLKHADDKVDQYFALNGRLSAVLDWEGAYTTTKEEAFMAPCAFWVSDEHGISTRLSRDEEQLMEVYISKGRPDLADCVRQGLLYRLLDPVSWECMSLHWIQHFRKTFGGGQDGVSVPETVEAWQSECLNLFKDDPGLPAILARHEHCRTIRSVPRASSETTSPLQDAVG